MSGMARWATSPPQTAWMGGAPAATRARIQRGPVGWMSPLSLPVPGLALRDGGQDRGLSWPGGRAQTPAKSPEWAPGRRGGPAALCLRRRRQSLRSATAASSGGDFPRWYSTQHLVWLHECCESLTVSVSAPQCGRGWSEWEVRPVKRSRARRTQRGRTRCHLHQPAQRQHWRWVLGWTLRIPSLFLLSDTCFFLPGRFRVWSLLPSVFVFFQIYTNYSKQLSVKKSD